MLQANLKRRSSKPRLCFRAHTTLPPVSISDPAEERGLTPSAAMTWLTRKSPEQRAASAASTGKMKITKANPSPQPEYTRASIPKRIPVLQSVTVTIAGIYFPTLAFSGFTSFLDSFDIRCFILFRLYLGHRGHIIFSSSFSRVKPAIRRHRVSLRYTNGRSGPKIPAEWNKTLSNEPGNEGQGDKEDDGKEAAACSH